MLTKKIIEQYLKLNYHDFVKYDILNNYENFTELILDYGKDKMKIRIQQTEDYKSLIRLVDTEFLD